LNDSIQSPIKIKFKTLVLQRRLLFYLSRDFKGSQTKKEMAYKTKSPRNLNWQHGVVDSSKEKTGQLLKKDLKH
jgi:hypothetical protein